MLFSGNLSFLGESLDQLESGGPAFSVFFTEAGGVLFSRLVAGLGAQQINGAPVVGKERRMQ